MENGLTETLIANMLAWMVSKTLRLKIMMIKAIILEPLSVRFFAIMMEIPLTNARTSGKNPDFPTTASGNQKLTYMNTYSMTYDAYAERANNVKTKVKGFDSNYQMRIYTWLEDKLNVTFNTISGVNIGDRISSYISEKRNSTENSLRTTNIETWDSFVEQLEVQQSQRKTKLIPETCALHFKEGFKNNSDSTVVEACYY